MQHRIVFIEADTVAPTTRLRRPAFPHSWTGYDKTRPEEIADRLRDATIAIVNKLPIGADVLEQCPDLRLIAVAATGTDNIDLGACAARGIVVSNVRGYAVRTVPEHVFALILALRRALVDYRERVRAGDWENAGQFCFFATPIEDLAGTRLGIVGRGTIGRAVARLGEAFGMEVLFAGRKGRSEVAPPYVPFDRVLAESDVISLHCPLIPETRDLIGRAEFERMARRPIMINTARGGLVDEAALADALDHGLIAGAGFDVTLPEPPPPGSPLLRIAGRPNVIVTPHVAWASRDAMQTLADQLIDNIERFVDGAPQNVVAPRA